MASSKASRRRNAVRKPGVVTPGESLRNCCHEVQLPRSMKLRRVDICETVGRFLYGARFGEVARKALSSSDSFSPVSGMWAAIYTKPTTDGSVPASVITAPP
jgi:hypothetical protein